ncbi:MAG TPA: alpha/beta hydrolase [Burkholderiales bacterium]|jgi:pimeloyl-ACP methyl ester carboxylesterase|nr:alpha/beta hydrolase [Burkholderiales bacterium]
MPHATASDGVRLYYEEAGRGNTVIFVHEFAGDHRSWEPQMRHFSRRYRSITFSARGYPPSDVPDDLSKYSQECARDDVVAVLDHLKVDKAHVVGLSMGGFATLHVGLKHPARARSLVIAGCGYGAQPGAEDAFRAECEAAAAAFVAEGAKAAIKYSLGPTRVQFQNKNPRAWQEFADQLADHSPTGSALTLRGVQMRRPMLYQLVADMKRIDVPTLVMTGDEDDPCLEASILLKRSIPTAGLLVMPRAGHTINIEDSEAFNAAVADFFAAVEAGRWERRDPRSLGGGILGFVRE